MVRPTVVAPSNSSGHREFGLLDDFDIILPIMKGTMIKAMWKWRVSTLWMGLLLGRLENSNVFFHLFLPLPNGERYDFFQATPHLAVLSKSLHYIVVHDNKLLSSERDNIKTFQQLLLEVAGRRALFSNCPVNLFGHYQTKQADSDPICNYESEGHLQLHHQDTVPHAYSGNCPGNLSGHQTKQGDPDLIHDYKQVPTRRDNKSRAVEGKYFNSPSKKGKFSTVDVRKLSLIPNLK